MRHAAIVRRVGSRRDCIADRQGAPTQLIDNVKRHDFIAETDDIAVIQGHGLIRLDAHIIDQRAVRALHIGDIPVIGVEPEARVAARHGAA